MPARHPSAATIAELALQKLDGQLQSIESLDGKASTLIGFSGVVLGLVFTSSASDNWTDGITVGIGLILAAILALGVALLPRRYKTNPNILALRNRYLDDEPDLTNLAIIDSIQIALVYNADITVWKVRAIRLGTFLAIVGILVTSASLIYSVTTNQPITHQKRGGSK
jgi:hypothetical protein